MSSVSAMFECPMNDDFRLAKCLVDPAAEEAICAQTGSRPGEERPDST
jgi:hypothetical protein